MTVDGCLGGSQGAYTVQDKTSGTTYNLTGIQSNLDSHVGQEVQASGTPASASDNSGATRTATGAGAAANGNTIHVTSMKKVGDTCTAGAK